MFVCVTFSAHVDDVRAFFVVWRFTVFTNCSSLMFLSHVFVFFSHDCCSLWRTEMSVGSNCFALQIS